MRSVLQYSSLGFAALASLVSLLPIVDAKLYASLQAFSDAKEQSFDYIIVGAGAGGSVLARRLSEDASVRVLLLEAGPNNVPPALEIEVPGLNQQIGPFYQWNYTTTPQVGANNRSIAAPRGFAMGGSTTINGMVYTRGSMDDFNLWGNVTQDPRWTWDALQPWLTRHEGWRPPVGGRNDTGQFDPSLHNTTGPILTTLTWSGPSDYDQLNTDNVNARPDEFRLNLDSNNGQPIGVSWTQFTFGEGKRSSAGTGYLDDATRQRRNLIIVVGAEVKRVVPSTPPIPAHRNLDIRTVEVGSRVSNATVSLTANKEVILSSGTYGTPHILLNSGIGNRTELQSVGVPTILNLPDVGKGLIDHVAMFVLWTTSGNPTPVNNTVALAQWEIDHTGPLSEFQLIGRRILWSRIAANNSIWSQFQDPSSGPTSPHLEIPLGLTGPTLAAVVTLVTPQSRGTVKLASTNPLADPLIDPGYLTNPFDVAAIKEGVRIAKNYYSGPAWTGLITGFLGPDPDTLSAAAFEDALRGSVSNTHHPVGTASMSAKSSPNGVVDPELRVKGVDGLRVVDASVMPYVPSGHTQAPTYILAERAADMIRNGF